MKGFLITLAGISAFVLIVAANGPPDRRSAADPMPAAQVASTPPAAADDPDILRHAAMGAACAKEEEALANSLVQRDLARARQGTLPSDFMDEEAAWLRSHQSPTCASAEGQKAIETYHDIRDGAQALQGGSR